MPADVQAADGAAVQWAVALGEDRQDRDDSAAWSARAREEEQARLTAAAGERWPAIVAGIRSLADAFNAGASRVILVVSEQARETTVTVSTRDPDTPSLTATLDGTLICVRASDLSGAPRFAEIRVHPDRSDAETAAYVLQNWLQRL